MRRTRVLMYLRLECSVNCARVSVSRLSGVAKVPFVFSHVGYFDNNLCMGFATAMHVLLLKNTKGVFPTEGFRLEVFLLVLTRHCVILAAFHVLLCGLKWRWYERLTHDRTFLRWFREVHFCPLVEWPLASAYHVCRCGEITWGKFITLLWSKSTKSGTRRPCSTYGLVPLNNNTSRTIKRHFVHRWGVFYPGRYK